MGNSIPAKWSGYAPIGLRCCLLLVGLAVAVLGLNVGLGGIRTLGWQGPTDFVTISNPAAFSAQNSHVRFLGGVWLGVGLLLMASSLWTRRLTPVIQAIFVMIFVGGLARAAGGGSGELASSSIWPSLLAELVLFPALGVWVWRISRRSLPND